MRHLPKFSYIGLTIILSEPSRFDIQNKELLSGNGGFFFTQECLRPECNRYQCDVRTVDEKAPLLPGTKVILLLGEKAQHVYGKLSTTLDENRGSPFLGPDGIYCISSFAPQDCADMKNYEKTHNPLKETVEQYLSAEATAGELFESKGRGRTARSNYRFWLQKDTKKAIRILNNDGKLPSPLVPPPEYIIRPSSREIIEVLEGTAGDFLHIDIETDFISLDIRCIAFAFESKPQKVYIFPVLDTHYDPAYSNLPQILRALVVAFSRNTTVAHNGALFDFLVFAYKYRMPVGRDLWDTMVAAQRTYPDVEKSLGHCMSLHTYEPYHKNEGVHSYQSDTQAQQLMLYCGKDVYGMMLVRKAQQEMMNKDAGLANSITLANKAIRPFLISSYLGMKFDEKLRRDWIKENDELMTQYLRIIKILTGDDVPHLISNKNNVEYFHNRLGYKVVSRSAKTGNASLDEGSLIQLKMQHPDNIVIDFLLNYRQVQKQTGTLDFKTWLG